MFKSSREVSANSFGIDEGLCTLHILMLTNYGVATTMIVIQKNVLIRSGFNLYKDCSLYKGSLTEVV